MLRIKTGACNELDVQGTGRSGDNGALVKWTIVGREGKVVGIGLELNDVGLVWRDGPKEKDVGMAWRKKDVGMAWWGKILGWTRGGLLSLLLVLAGLLTLLINVEH